MAAKSIMVIGDIGGYSSLISHALTKGYKILYTEDFESGFSFIDKENVKLIIVGNATISKNGFQFSVLRNRHETRDMRHETRESQVSSLKSQVSSLLKTENLKLNFLSTLVESEVPIILTGRNGFGSAITEAFQDLMPVTLRESEGRRDIDNAIECWFKEAIESDCLVFKQEKEFVSIELNGNKAQKAQGRIKRAITFMEEHYGEDISLNQIAHAAYLNPYYFCRLFGKQVGTTCSKYLSILRVEKAKELLKDKELSVTEVCFMVGFNSLTHFERVFKGIEGITPSAYRSKSMGQ